MSLVTDLPAIFISSLKLARKAFSPSWISRSAHSAGWHLLHLYAARDPDGSRAVVVSLCSTSDETIEEAEKICRATSAR